MTLGLDDIHSPLTIVEEIIVGAEEPADSVLLPDPAHFVDDAFAALEPMLALVVRGDGAVGAGKLAAEGHHQ